LSIRDFLGLPRSASSPSSDTETVRRIVRELEQLEPMQARYLAAFAYVLSRVANADQLISESETEKMIELVRRLAGLSEEQAILTVAIAKSQNQLFGGTEDFLVTRQFREMATDEQRHHLLDCLFAVSAADESITSTEESRVRQIASELGFEHHEYVQARMVYGHHRSVLRGST
jgi:uncharacterized tellurite resistance protein B-like protein